MSDLWIKVLTGPAIGASVLAELNLLRMLLRERRESRAEGTRSDVRLRPLETGSEESTPERRPVAFWPLAGGAGVLLLVPWAFAGEAPDAGAPVSGALSSGALFSFQPPPDQTAPTAAEPSEPPRRAPPSPWSSPPFPGSEYLGPTIGVPNSTPDYALMNLLKDTDFGKFQRESRIDIYGWINASWNWSTSKDSNLPNVYDIVPNRVELDQAVIRIERNPDTVQTTHADWGFRVTNLYGTDYRFTVAKGWFDHQLLDHNDLYGYDMPELYGLFYTPDVAEGMVIKFGRFISPPDIEAQLAPDNYLFTHSTMFSIDPYTFTGVIADIKLSNYWSIQPGITGGADMAPWSDSATPNGHFMVKWTSEDNNDSIWAGINSLGDGKYRNGHDNLQQIVGTWSHRFSEKVHTLTEAYYMWQFDALKGGTVNNGPVRSFGGGGGPGPLIPGLSDSIGMVNYTQFQLSDTDYISVRNDFLADFQGQRTGFENYYSSHTVGWSHNLTPWSTIRPEIKYERGYNTDAYDLGRKRDQLKFGVDLIVRF